MSFLDLYEKHLHARRLAPKSIGHMFARIAHFEHWLSREKHKDDARDVTLQDVLDYHDLLRRKRHTFTKQPLTAGYCNSHIYDLRGYYHYLHQMGRILVDPCADLPELHAPRPLPKGVLSTSETMRLLQQPKATTLFGFRDRVILELLYSTGLRGLEVCRLSIYDVDLNEGTVTVRKGKGGKDRVVPMGKAATEYLAEYLARVRPKMMARVPGRDAVERLFFSQRRHPLQPQMLYHMVRKNRKKAGLPDTTTTRSLRHACATAMLRGGASVRHVQEMLGHSQINTTQIYTRVVPSDLKKVHAKTSPSERGAKGKVPSRKFRRM